MKPKKKIKIKQKNNPKKEVEVKPIPKDIPRDTIGKKIYLYVMNM